MVLNLPFKFNLLSRYTSGSLKSSMSFSSYSGLLQGAAGATPTSVSSNHTRAGAGASNQRAGAASETTPADVVVTGLNVRGGGE